MGLIPLIMGITQMAMAPKAPPPPAAPEPPAAIGDEGRTRAAREAEMRRRRQTLGGRASTIMSGSPLGATSPAPVGQKYLTGA